MTYEMVSIPGTFCDERLSRGAVAPGHTFVDAVKGLAKSVYMRCTVRYSAVQYRIMRITVSLPQDLAEKLRAEAIANDRSDSGQIRWIIKEKYNQIAPEWGVKAVMNANRPKDHKPCASATCPWCRS